MRRDVAGKKKKKQGTPKTMKKKKGGPPLCLPNLCRKKKGSLRRVYMRTTEICKRVADRSPIVFAGRRTVGTTDMFL
jgi:hypothetical protein